MASKVGLIKPAKTILLLCDMQQKFAKSITHFNEIVETSGRLATCAKLLQIPSLITEHYPKGLGPTVDLIKSKAENAKILDKTLFSMCTEQVIEHIEKTVPNYESVILCGIEAHACVLSTALDFLSREKDVHVITDAVSSRNLADRKYAFIRMQQSGAFLTTAESIMFQLCKNAKHPKFREIQQLIMTPTPDSSLLKM